MFDFESNKQNFKETLSKVWENFRNDLKSQKLDYTDLATIKKLNFLDRFDNLLNYGKNKSSLTKTCRYIQVNATLYRGAILTLEESNNINDSRFIPNQQKFPSINRFSPEGVDYLYLALSFNCKNKYNKNLKSSKFNSAEETCIQEIRAKTGDIIGLCKFKINELSLDKKLIDLTTVQNKSIRDLEEDLQQVSPNKINKACLNLLLKFISLEIFKPLEGVEKEFEYLPFHCLAYYFSKLGFDGIMYPSTIFESGKNLVLFDKNHANPFGDIRIENL